MPIKDCSNKHRIMQVKKKIEVIKTIVFLKPHEIERQRYIS